MSELKPCPFCGCRDNLEILECEIPFTEGDSFSIRCCNCGTCCEDYDSVEECERNWNIRPLEEAEQEKVKGLSQIIDSQKQTADTLIKKNKRLVEALNVIADDTRDWSHHTKSGVAQQAIQYNEENEQ